ncbi:unnamed protein product [Zymoseptoria tritici ST99CH_1E4]|uniref:LysM domain-containing protein n=1 Tax=Zymoseptoria tritici ST99CH_1E4 TaxID=1276532 RepID=A0A2H1H3I4_ZYMTR|nr:unnamed protein product [Zymoseptoria tritici ST99CH_1E4]
MQNIFLAATLLGAAFAAPQNPPTSCSAAPQPTGTGSPGTVCGSTTFTNYTVKAGDTLGAIAKQYKSGVCDIAKVNGIDNPDYIKPDQVLSIPANCVTPDNTSCVKPVPVIANTCVLGVGSTYTVKSGDSFSAIATSFNITLASLEARNPQIPNYDLIFPGQVINTPLCPNSVCDSIGTYVIESGDIFYNLAQKNNVTVGQLESLNVNVNVTDIHPGDIIILPHNCHNITASA